MTVALAAFAFRVLFILWGWSGWRTTNNDPISTIMSRVYIYEGYALCAGYGYVQPIPGVDLPKMAALGRIGRATAIPVSPSDLEPEMLHPPGMAILCAAIHWTTGGPVEVPLEFLGALLDSITACLVYWLVTTFLCDRVGFVAGLIYAFYPPVAAASGMGKSPEGLLSVFIIGCLGSVLHATRCARWKAVGWWIIAGVCVGVGAYLRPDYLFVPVALATGLWLYTRRFWRSVAALAIMQAVALLLLLPWAYRNHQLCGRWIFTSTSPGATLITGLGQYQNPWGFGGNDEDRYAEARAQGFKSPWGPEADAYFRRVFWDSVRNNPFGYLMTVVKRIPMVVFNPQGFGYANPHKTQSFEAARAQGKTRFDVLRERPLYVLAAYWDWLLMGLIGFAALLCSIYMLLREWHHFGLVFLVMSPHLYSLGTHLLSHFEPRYVLPSMFSFLIGLGYAVAQRGSR